MCAALKTTARMTERARSQRARILEAAQKCFIESGFHAASMASIAEAAEMSPGLIYRYFENKHAIVLAIIERQLEEKRSDIAALHSDTELHVRIRDLYGAWVDGDPRVMNPALFLEMTAEASRKREIAEALRCADEVAREDFVAWLRQRGAERGDRIDEGEAGWRSLALQLVIEGLVLRAIREPDLDRRLVNRVLDELLPILLPAGSAPDRAT